MACGSCTMREHSPMPWHRLTSLAHGCLACYGLSQIAPECGSDLRSQISGADSRMTGSNWPHMWCIITSHPDAFFFFALHVVWLRCGDHEGVPFYACLVSWCACQARAMDACSCSPCWHRRLASLSVGRVAPCAALPMIPVLSHTQSAL